jgi:hypothetical protein
VHPNHQALAAPAATTPDAQVTRRAATPVLVVSSAATGTVPTAARPVIAAPAPVPPPASPTAPPAARREFEPPRPSRRPARRGGVVRQLSPLQVVCWQVAVLAVAASLGRPWPVIACAGAGAAVVLAVTTIRIRGRWLYQVLAPAVGYLLRTRRHNLAEDDKSVALLGLLLPGSTTLTVHTGQGPALAISHPAGLTTLIRPKSTGRGGPPPPPAALLPDTDDTHRFGIQTVFHSAARSDQPPRFWLTVHAARTVDTPTDDELTQALRNGLRRVLRSLNRMGLPAEPMPAEAALATVAALGHVTGGRTEIREDWRFWRTGAVSHTCFRLVGWDRLTADDADRLLAALATRTAGIAGIAVTMTIAAHTSGARPSAVLRLAATTEAAIDSAITHLTGLFASCGVRPVRFDGTQVAGVAASLPIGGFPR